MTRRSHIVALAAVFALAGVGVIVAAQQRPTRVSDQQIGDLLRRMDAGITVFRASFDQAINSSRINGSRAEDDINQSVNDFKQATDRLRDREQDRRAGATDVEDVLRRASVLDGFMATNALEATAEHDWQSLRGNLDELARAYDVAWNWTGPRNATSGLNDQHVKQLLTRTKKNADRFRHSLVEESENVNQQATVTTGTVVVLRWRSRAGADDQW